MSESGVLLLVAGKMGAGKSTKSLQLSRERNAVRLSEDEWLAALYPGQVKSLDDYVRLSRQLKTAIRSHVVALLQRGTNVVLDFPANTVEQRRWLKVLADDAGAKHELIFLARSDERCLRQIAKRRTDQPDRAAFDTDAVFREVTQYFEEPSEDEGLTITVIE
ncbi:MAG: ATP-binding protein [Pseudomonadota bacterium]